MVLATDRYETVEWLKDADRLTYGDYWNDEQEERQKPFWILDGNFASMEAYLARNGFPAQLRACVDRARARFGRGVDGVGVDLGAGNLWGAPHLFALGNVEHLYCVEYSRHRLLKLGPAVLDHYGVPPNRVTLALGDLHSIRLQDASVDFVFLSAAFHHSDQPDNLLREIRRVLKPGGVVIIIGEHITDAGILSRLRHMAKFIVARTVPAVAQKSLFGRTLTAERFVPRDEDLLIGDSRLGDHAYMLNQYRTMFAAAGFASEVLRRREWPYQAFVLAPIGAA